MRSPMPSVLLALLALVALATAACYQRSESRPQVDEDARDLTGGRPTLTLSIVPERLPTEDILRYSAVADRLSAGTPCRVLLKATATSSAALARLRNGEADLAILGSAAYLRARHNLGAVGLARLEEGGRTTCRAAIVVRRDDPATAIEDLRGRRLGLIDPTSTIGQLLPLAGLREAGVRLSDLAGIRYFDREEAVARAVRLAEVDAGALRDLAAGRHETRGLRTVWTSPPVPGRVLVARRGLEPDVIDALRRAALAPPTGETLEGAPPPLFKPLEQTEDVAVEALMRRVYGPAALESDLRLAEAITR
jgi:phosphate/phosphite/phosphonate ABC transporter binding protein